MMNSSKKEIKMNEVLIKNRDSNIEVLRILAMIMIIASHVTVHGFINLVPPITINKVYLHVIQLGHLGVNLFMIISGYFLISSNRVNINKLIKLVIQCLSISVSIYLVFIILGANSFNIKEMINHILFYNIWWFPKTYILIYILHPYINKLLHLLTEIEYKKLIATLTVVLSIIPTLTSQVLNDGSLIWYIYIYILGGYIKLYSKNFKWNSRKYLVIALIIFVLIVLSIIAFDILGNVLPLAFEHSRYFYDTQRFPLLLLTLFLFLGFSKLNIKSNKFINIVSSSTFGIYLLHEHDSVRNWLWNFLDLKAYLNSSLLIPYSILAICLIFIVCSLIELARIYLLEKKYMKLINKKNAKNTT